MKSEEAASKVGTGSAGREAASIVNDMLNAGLVKPTEKFQSNSAKKSKRMSEKDKSKMSAMIKGLAKYTENEDEISEDFLSSSSKTKKGSKSPHKSSPGHDSSSLSELIDSELAVLRPRDTEDLSLTSDKSQKTGAHVASVSKEQQVQFECMLKEDLVSATAGVVGLHLSDGARPKVQDEVTESDGTEQQKRQEAAKSSSIKKGGKKSAKKKGGDAANEELGSYSQLLISMGNRSASQRNNDAQKDEDGTVVTGEQCIDVSDDTRIGPSVDIEMVRPLLNDGTWTKQWKYESAEAFYQQVLAGTVVRTKKKRNKKPKITQQDQINPSVTHETNTDRPQSANNAKKKGKGATNMPQEQDVHVDRPAGVQTSNKQKKKNKRGSIESVEQFQTHSRPYVVQQRHMGTAPSSHSQLNTAEQRQYPMDTQDSYTEMIVKVPKQEHVYVIGPQGRHLHEIMAVTGVCVSVPPLNYLVEDIVLRGSKMQLGTAVALMFSKSQSAQIDASCRMGSQQGQVQYQNPKVMGQGHGQQMQRKGHGNKNRDVKFDQDNRNLNISVNISQDSNRGHRGQLEHHVTSTPMQHGQRQVKGQHAHQHLNQQGQFFQQSQLLNLQGQHLNPQGHHLHHQGQNLNPQGQHLHYQGQNLTPQGQHLHHQGHGRPAQGHGQTPQQDIDQDSAVKSQGKRQRKKKNVYAEYMPMEEVSEGLKRGSLIEGPVRINPRNFEEGYVPHPDGKSDILICGTKGRNRALNGDKVAVQLMDEGDWKMNKEELEELEKSVTADKDEATGTQDSDTEVVIECEIIERSTEKAQNLTPKVESHKKYNNHSPAKKYLSLRDMMVGQSPGRKKLLAEGGKDEIKKLLQRTGKVVAILERKHSRACTGFIKPMQDRNPHRAMFSPIDHRMPRIIIPMENCPTDFLERTKDYAKTLYVCRITDWKQDSLYAEGCLAKSLGEAGEIDPETEGMLIENGIDFDEFPQEALDCLPADLPWRIPTEEFHYRRDFRSACVFTIDPATARDLDDALSCEDLGDGRYKVGVHIADVSYFLHENNVLDRVAALRSTSVYLVHKVIPMLPRLLCEQLCSLNPDEDRLTFSVEWVISEQGDIEEEWFGRSVIRSCVKLAYEHAQGFIEEPDRIWTQEELPPVSENFTVDDIKTRVLNLQKIAANLRKSRFDGGALRLDQVKLQYSLDADSGLPNGYWVYQQKDSNRLVEEFMLLANMAVAHRINGEYPDKALLRRHPPPQEKMVENLRDQCSAFGIQIDISSAGAIQRSLRSYYGDDDESMARMQVLVALCSKPMQLAKYFCTGCIDDESLYHHYGLNVPLYTHFTSPIRRYPDVMVHRLLGASLDYCKEPSKSPGEIQKLAEHCNDKKTAAKTVGDLSSELFFAVFVKTAGPLEERGMVMAVLDKAFDVFVIKLGVSKRVYCDKLPIKEKIFKRERKVPSLLLVWKSEGDEPEVRQEITIFTVVECVLQQGDQPLQWTAVIKRPQVSEGYPPIEI